MTGEARPIARVGPTVLLTLSGPDRSGVTAELFGVLSAFDVDVLDVEQVVVRGHLVLAVLLTAGSSPDELGEAINGLAHRLGLAVELQLGTGDQAETRSAPVAVSVLGYPLPPAAIAGLARRLADLGANIDGIRRLAAYPVTSVQLDASGADPTAIRRALSSAAAELGVDVGVEPSGLLRRAKRLIVMDVDSTLIQGEVIEMLAARAGAAAEVGRITDEAMAGRLDFEESLRARVATLAGLPESVLAEVRAELRLTPGARTLVRTLKRLDYRFAIVSGGFTQTTEHLLDELGLDYLAANTLEVSDGRLTGGLVGPIVDRAGKAAALRRFASQAGVAISQTVAVGDGANDLDMLAEAGLGIAFNAKPVVRRAADVSVTVPFLDPILYLLGISREEVEAADAADGLDPYAPPVLDGSERP